MYSLFNNFAEWLFPENHTMYADGEDSLLLRNLLMTVIIILGKKVASLSDRGLDSKPPHSNSLPVILQD